MFAHLTAGLDFQATALGLRSERQRLIASNIANADTPGYVGRDLDFKKAMAEAVGGHQPKLAASTASDTRRHAAHFVLPGAGGHFDGDSTERGYTLQTQPAMDNNSVDLDRERANFVDNAVRYESTLRFINGHSRTMLSAIQGQ
jgi:flagellar basal-body rod protein FlgB